MQLKELAHEAKDRGVVDDARVGLQKLVLIILNENMSKDDAVRSSKWSSAKLTPMQKKYAALDATKSLEVYLKLNSMESYSDHLPGVQAKHGTKTDIIAPHGQVGANGMGVIAGVGTIIENEAWDPPAELQIRRIQTRKKLRGELSKLSASLHQVLSSRVTKYQSSNRQQCV